MDVSPDAVPVSSGQEWDTRWGSMVATKRTTSEIAFPSAGLVNDGIRSILHDVFEEVQEVDDRIVTSSEHDVEVAANYRLQLVDIGKSDFGNPNRGSDAASGAWRYTFRLNVGGVAVLYSEDGTPVFLSSDAPADSDYWNDLLLYNPLREFFRVIGPAASSAASDYVSISARRDRDLFGSVDSSSLMRELAEGYYRINGEQFYRSPDSIGEMLENIPSDEPLANEVSVLDDALARYEKKREQAEAQRTDDLIVSLLNFVPYLGETIDAVTAADAFMDAFASSEDVGDEISMGVPAWQGFQYKRPMRHAGPVVSSHLVFDVHVSPAEDLDGEGPEFAVHSSVKGSGTKMEWAVSIDPPSIDTGSIEDAYEGLELVTGGPSSICTPRFENIPVSKWDPNRNRKVTQAPNDPYDKEQWVDTTPEHSVGTTRACESTDEGDVVFAAGPKPQIWYPDDVDPKEGIVLDGYQTKRGSAPIDTYSWTLRRPEYLGGGQIDWDEYDVDPSGPELDLSSNVQGLAGGAWEVVLEATDELNRTGKTKDTLVVGDEIVPRVEVLTEDPNTATEVEFELTVVGTRLETSIRGWRLKVQGGPYDEWTTVVSGDGDDDWNTESRWPTKTVSHTFDEPADPYTVVLEITGEERAGEVPVYESLESTFTVESTNSITISSPDGTERRYELEVDGRLEGESGDSGGERTTASGEVKTEPVTHRYTGSLERFQGEDVAVEVDGTAVDPGERVSTHTITIQSPDGRAAYDFAVEGDLERSDALGASRNEDEDEIGADRTRAVGTVMKHVNPRARDSYTYSGSLERFQAEGVTVYLDGSRVDPADRVSVHTVTVDDPDDGGEDYELEVARDLRRSDALGASVEGDEVDGTTARGYVEGGRDSYTFGGPLEAIRPETLTVYLDGSAVDPADYEPPGVIEDFESGDLADWTVVNVGRGGPSTVEVTAENPYEGTYGLVYEGTRRTRVVSTDADLPYPTRGDTFEVRVDYVGWNDAVFGWGIQSERPADGYYVAIDVDQSASSPKPVTMSLKRRTGGEETELDGVRFERSLEYAGQYLRWVVDWGDSTVTVTGYTEAGTEFVTLRADEDDAVRTFDEGGICCGADARDSGTVYFDAWRYADAPGGPTAALAAPADGVDAGEAVTFDASGSTGTADGGSLTYAWSVDGEELADETAPTLVHSFDDPGEHEVAVTVADGGGSDTATTTVEVGDAAGIIESFEDDSVHWSTGERGATGSAEYSLTTDERHVYRGTRALEYEGDRKRVLVSDGTLDAPSRGDAFEWRWYPGPGENGAVFGFGIQSGDFREGYEIKLRHGGWSNFPDTVELRVRDDGTDDLTTLDRTPFDAVRHNEQWLRWEVEWGTDPDDPAIAVRVFGADGTELATLRANDDSYDAGRLALSGGAPAVNRSYFDAWRYVTSVERPTARLAASADRVGVGREVTFDAGDSTGATDGEELAYAWYVDGEEVDVTGPTFARSFDATGTHEVAVRVTDGDRMDRASTTVEVVGGTLVDDFEDGDTSVLADDWNGWVAQGATEIAASRSNAIEGTYSGHVTLGGTNGVKLYATRESVFAPTEFRTLYDVKRPPSRGATTVQLVREGDGKDKPINLHFESDGKLYNEANGNALTAYDGDTTYELSVTDIDFSSRTFGLAIVDRDADAVVFDRSDLEMNLEPDGDVRGINKLNYGFSGVDAGTEVVFDEPRFDGGDDRSTGVVGRGEVGDAIDDWRDPGGDDPDGDDVLSLVRRYLDAVVEGDADR